MNYIIQQQNNYMYKEFYIEDKIVQKILTIISEENLNVLEGQKLLSFCSDILSLTKFKIQDDISQ